MSDELTFKEKAVLLILMAEACEIPNALLSNRYHTKLEKPGREKLRRLGLINARKAGPFYFVELSDLGWKQCTAEFGADIPAGGGAPGGALYAILGTVRRYVDRAGMTYPDFFGHGDDAPAATPADVEAAAAPPPPN